MSNCANLVNRLFSELCVLKEREAKVGLMLDILQIDQAIFKGLDLTVYIVPNDASTASLVGLPVVVSRTTGPTNDIFSGLIVLSKLNSDCIVYTTKDLLKYGTRTPTGFFSFSGNVPITVFPADVSILTRVSQFDVLAALKVCADTIKTETVTCEAYDALVSYLYTFGIRNLSVFQAACIYRTLQSLKQAEYNTSEEVVVESSTHSVTPNVIESAVSYQNQPFEPAQPFEPSDLITNVYVRQLRDSTISESLSNNESIELKLKALLEATESSEQTD